MAEPSAASAARAGLFYLSETTDGIRRRRCGKGFCYYDAAGQTVRDAATLERIRALALPPAWTDVWISPHPDSHLQAWGTDARGRRQYRYHVLWTNERDRSKFERMLDFGRTLPTIRAAVAHDLQGPGVGRSKVLAALTDLLDKTFMRVGNDAYARSNRSYGLSTLRDRHVHIDGATLVFDFRGKSGVRQRLQLTDRRLARIVQRCHDLPGQELFQYRDSSGEIRPVDSADINRYVQEISGAAFTAKDFRTWHASRLAAQALLDAGPPDNASVARRCMARAIDTVARRLGNTRTVCRACYVHPGLLQAYAGGDLAERLGLHGVAEPRVDDAALLHFLEQYRTDPAAADRL